MTPQDRMGSSSLLDNSYFLILTRALYFLQALIYLNFTIILSEKGKKIP